MRVLRWPDPSLADIDEALRAQRALAGLEAIRREVRPRVKAWLAARETPRAVAPPRDRASAAARRRVVALLALPLSLAGGILAVISYSQARLSEGAWLEAGVFAGAMVLVLATALVIETAIEASE